MLLILAKNSLFKQEEGLSDWHLKYSSLFRFSMAFRGCKYEISTGLLLGFPGPWYCLFLCGCATNCLKTFQKFDTTDLTSVKCIN